MAFGIKKALEGMLKVGASDLHLKVDQKPMIRLHGVLRPIEHFITGASRGLGRACALALAEAGADVALAATNTDALEEVAGEVRKLGRSAVICPLDISGSASARSAVGKAARELGRLDILVNAAGICPRVTCLEMSDEEMQTTFEVNVFGTFYVCTEAAKHMQEAAVQKSGGGRIVT